MVTLFVVPVERVVAVSVPAVVRECCELRKLLRQQAPLCV
jgi:hypothetical protein